jgi:hypothetical protein
MLRALLSLETLLYALPTRHPQNAPKQPLEAFCPCTFSVFLLLFFKLKNYLITDSIQLNPVSTLS